MPSAATVSRLLEGAILAPSSHNTQPWIFDHTADRIRVFADRTRALPVNDPEDRELEISCGCAVMNLRIAAANEGIGTRTMPRPDPDDADLLAEIRLAGAVETGLAALADGMARRRTYRKRFETREVVSGVIQGLQAAAEAEGAWLVPLADPTRRLAAAKLVAEGDALQWANPSWRRELAQWMHPRRRGDGLVLPGLAVPIAQAVIRSFDMGGGIGAKDAELAEQSPVLAVLGTEQDGPADWLRAGQALQRVLLLAVTSGLQASYLNQPVELPQLRPRLATLCERTGAPQILMRLGYPAEQVPAAPRRPLAYVVQP